MILDKDLLEILICPQCQGKVTPAPEEDGLICPACRLKFPVRDQIPVMMVSEAEPLE